MLAAPTDLDGMRNTNWAQDEDEDEASKASRVKVFRKAIVRVEPKTFFANERTLVDWLHVTVLLSTVGIALMHLAGKKTAMGGQALCFAALFLMVYALRTFWWRSEAIEAKKDLDYSDPYGPPLLVTVLAVSITCSVVIGLRGEFGVGEV